ncbi:hypothetical protein D3C83_14650 [compost metagenome]
MHGALDLALPLAGARALEARGDIAPELGEPRRGLVPARRGHAHERRKLHAEYRAGAAVDGAQIQLLVERQHAGGQVREQALEVGLGLRERRLIALGLRARFRQLQRHRVEGLGQHADLVARCDRRTLAVIAARHRARAFHQHAKRRRQAVGEHERERDR